MSDKTSIVFFFIDGLGAGPEDAAINPMAAETWNYFHIFRDTPVPADLPRNGRATLLDATLGVPGLPQSATGQTTLLTGINAARHLDRHLYGFPNRKLRDLLKEESIIRKLSKRGKQAAFVNAFRPLFFEIEREKIIKFLSATTLSNLAGDAPFRSLEDLREERSIYQEFTNRSLREKGFDVPIFTPQKAGRILAEISRELDFTLFEYFQSDRAGHSRDMEKAVGIIGMLDRFLDALIVNTDLSNTTILLTSDHGNIEDLSTGTHTENRVPLMAWGNRSEEVILGAGDIVDVPLRILRILA